MTTTATYTLSTITSLGFDDAVALVRSALAEEGFGVLTEIDVKATLLAKIGVEREPYLILGACNPTLAHQALSFEPELGALLPCNVVIYADDGMTRVSAIDAERMLSLVENDQVAPIAKEVRTRLQRVVAAVRD